MARLIAFLNFDFDAATETRLKKAGLKSYELDRPGWKERGAKLKEEIRLDLTPLLSETPTDEMQERAKLKKLRRQWQRQKSTDQKHHDMMLKLMDAGPRRYHGPRFYLDRLLEKINRLDLQFRWNALGHLLDKINGLDLQFLWYAESGQHEWTVYDPDLSKPLSKTTGYPEPVPGTERKQSNPTMRLLGPERRITTIVGEKFIVAKQLSHAKSFRELLYGIIAETLENGSFTKLRMCPQCGTFFVGEDLKRKFCGDRCKDHFFNLKKDFKGLRQKRQRELINKARRLFEEGKGAASVMDKTGLSRRILQQKGLLK